MKKDHQFNLRELGIFQNLTRRQMKNLGMYDLQLAGMPSVLFIKDGFFLKNGPLSLKPDLHARLKTALEKMKN